VKTPPPTTVGTYSRFEVEGKRVDL